MELDFIDVSRGENRRSRVRNASNERREASVRYAPDDSVNVLNIRSTPNVRRKTSDSGRRESNAQRMTESRKRTKEKSLADTRNVSETGRRVRTRSAPDRRGVPSPSGQQAVRNGKRKAGPVDPEVQQERLRRRKARRRKRIIARFSVMFCMALAIILPVSGLVFMMTKLLAERDGGEKVKPASVYISETQEIKKEEGGALKPAIREDFLTVNEYSRPGEALNVVNNIFVHYTANKGTSAAQNRSYFQNLGTTGETSASAHFIIGYDGEIVQCIPLDEIAYAVQKRNYDSISIECCYKYDDGRFTDETYQSLIQLCAWLLDKYDLEAEDMRRHYDEGGKKCPLYFVEHPDSWEQFKNDLKEYMARTDNSV